MGDTKQQEELEAIMKPLIEEILNEKLAARAAEGGNGEITVSPAAERGQPRELNLMSSGNKDYVVAAAQVGAAMWASPELQKGPTKYLALLPAAISLLDAQDQERRFEQALVPAGIGLLAMFASQAFK